MPTDTAVQPNGRQRSDIPSAAPPTRSERGDVDSIDPVARALPPEEGHSGRRGPSLSYGEAQVRVERQRIGRADQADGVRVGRSRKERVEGLQPLVFRISVPARRVGTQTHPGFEWNPVYREAHIGCQRPGEDV